MMTIRTLIHQLATAGQRQGQDAEVVLAVGENERYVRIGKITEGEHDDATVIVLTAEAPREGDR
jgi:hypothetical protein